MKLKYSQVEFPVDELSDDDMFDVPNIKFKVTGKGGSPSHFCSLMSIVKHIRCEVLV